MKKYLIFLLVSAAAAGVCVYVYFYQPFSRAEPVPVESVLPDDTLGMVKICRLTGQLKMFHSSRLGEALAGIDYSRVMDLMKLTDSQKKEAGGIIDAVKSAASSSWLDILFGREVAVALLGRSLASVMQGVDDFTAGQLTRSVVIVARPAQPARVMESLNGMLGTGIEIQSRDYQSVRINRFLLDNQQPVHYALHKGLVIAAFSPEPVERCLDLVLAGPAGGADGTLLNAPRYTANAVGLQTRGTVDFFGFADVEKVCSLMGPLLDRAQAVSRRQDPGIEMIRLNLAQLKGLTDLSLAQYAPESGCIKSRAVLGADRTDMSPQVAGLLDTAPEKNSTFRYVPSQALIYSWKNTVDLKLLWETVKSNPEITSDNAAMIHRAFSQQMGMDMDDFFTLFGSRAAVLLNDIRTGGMFPVPELALMIEVTDAGRIDALIRDQVQPINMPLLNETYRDTRITHVVLPLGGGLSPAYAFRDNYLMIAANRDLLKSMLDAGPEDNITAKPGFAAVDQGLTRENNQVLFFHSKEILAKVKEVIHWAMAWTAMTAPKEKTDRIGQILDNLVFPLMDGFQMVESVGIWTYGEETRIISDSVVALEAASE